jgi:hypothetical protein
LILRLLVRVLTRKSVHSVIRNCHYQLFTLCVDILIMITVLSQKEKENAKDAIHVILLLIIIFIYRILRDNREESFILEVGK